MTQNADFFKKISTLDMPGTGKLIVLAILTHKTHDVARLMEITGENRRTVQMYRLQWIEMQDETSETRETDETGCAKFAKDAQDISCGEHGTNPAHIEEHARLKEPSSKVSYTKEEVISPPSPSTALVTRSWEDDVAATQHKTITIENGRPILHNGTHAYWLGMFGNDPKRLELALLDAMGSIQTNSRQDPAKQITRRLAQIAGQKHDQDQRYQTAVKSKPQYRPAAEQRIDRARDFRSHLRTGRPS